MNTTLRTLDLSHNVITASGARAIAENLVGNTTLLHLFVSSNSIGNEGCQAFVNLMQGGNKNGLTSMVADSCREPQRTASADAQEEEQKRSEHSSNGPPDSRLRTISVDSNAIDDERVLLQLKAALTQKDPTSVHHQLKSIENEKKQAEDEIQQLKQTIAVQNNTLSKYRDKLSKTVVATIEGSSGGGGGREKGSKKKTRKKKKKKKTTGSGVKKKSSTGRGESGKRTNTNNRAVGVHVGTKEEEKETEERPLSMLITTRITKTVLHDTRGGMGKK